MPPPVKQMDRRQQVATALGVEKRALMRGKPRMLSDSSELGAEITQWNDATDNAGWTLYSVRVSATQ
jgi:hypothetical protein